MMQATGISEIDIWFPDYTTSIEHDSNDEKDRQTREQTRSNNDKNEDVNIVLIQGYIRDCTFSVRRQDYNVSYL